jgi:hypothetical protein
VGDGSDFAERVVGVGTAAAVQVLLGHQPVEGIPLKAVGLTIFIGKLQQAAVGVVAEMDAVAHAICAFD